MSTEIQQKFIKSFAREHAVTELDALNEFEKHFIDKTAVLPLIQKHDESDSKYPDENFSSVALAKINLEEKRLAAEDRRAALDERRLQLEEKFKDEQLRLDRERQREDALLNRWMMVGKNKEEFSANERLFERLLTMREAADTKFERLITENRNKPDAIQQMREYSLINKEMTENVFSAIENMGIDLSKIRGVMNLNKKASAWDKLAEVATPLIQKVTEAQQKQQLAPSGMENVAQVPPDALRLQAEMIVRAEVEKKAKENEILRAELEREKIIQKPWIDERNQLIQKARELGIKIFDGISNEDLLRQIEITEAE